MNQNVAYEQVCLYESGNEEFYSALSFREGRSSSVPNSPSRPELVMRGFVFPPPVNFKGLSQESIVFPNLSRFASFNASIEVG